MAWDAVGVIVLRSLFGWQMSYTCSISHAYGDNPDVSSNGIQRTP